MYTTSLGIHVGIIFLMISIIQQIMSVYLDFNYLHWFNNWSNMNNCISEFVSNSYNQKVFILRSTIRSVCIPRGELAL